MKNTLTVSLLIAGFTMPVVRGDCNKIEEYRNTISSLNEEIVSLQQTSDDILKKSQTDQDTYKVLKGDLMTGTELLREKENWQDTADKIEDEKKKTIKNAILPSVGLALVSGINYHLYKHPPDPTPVFSEELLRPVNGRTLARIMAGFFLVYTTAQTLWLGYKYYNLNEDVKEAHSKIDVLGSLAEVEDQIKRNERMITHYEIELRLLTQSCSP